LSKKNPPFLIAIMKYYHFFATVLWTAALVAATTSTSVEPSDIIVTRTLATDESPNEFIAGSKNMKQLKKTTTKK
jgi:hypothetical protein